jgi:hypothetical protein
LKFEFIFEKGLPLNQGPRTDVLMKKKIRVENIVTLSLFYWNILAGHEFVVEV